MQKLLCRDYLSLLMHKSLFDTIFSSYAEDPPLSLLELIEFPSSVPGKCCFDLCVDNVGRRILISHHVCVHHNTVDTTSKAPLVTMDNKLLRLEGALLVFDRVATGVKDGINYGCEIIPDEDGDDSTCWWVALIIATILNVTTLILEVRVRRIHTPLERVQWVWMRLIMGTSFRRQHTKTWMNTAVGTKIH